LKATPQRLTAFALFLASLFTGFEAFAAEPIDTDGPDFVESSEVIGKHRFQYEADVVSQRDRRPQTAGETTSTPTLLKYGITDTVELRLETEGRIRIANESGDAGVSSLQTGTGDTALGLKWHTQDREAAAGRPAISWILHFDTPSGTDGFKGHGIRPSLRSVVTWDLPQNFALGLMPGIKYDATNDGHRFTSGIFGAVLNRRITETFRAFAEISVPQLAPSRDGGTLADWDIGAAYLLTNDTQLGVRTGVAANRNTPSHYLLFELAQRF
jgi:hypothetical protein